MGVDKQRDIYNCQYQNSSCEIHGRLEFLINNPAGIIASLFDFFNSRDLGSTQGTNSKSGLFG